MLFELTAALQSHFSTSHLKVRDLYDNLLLLLPKAMMHWLLGASGATVQYDRANIQAFSDGEALF